MPNIVIITVAADGMGLHENIVDSVVTFVIRALRSNFSFALVTCFLKVTLIPWASFANMD